MSIVGIKADTNAATATLTLSFANENVLPVGIDTSSHKIYLNGTYIGEATCKAPLGIPARATEKQEAILQATNLERFRNLLGSAASQPASFRIESLIIVISGDDRVNIKSSNQGSLDIHSLTQGK